MKVTKHELAKDVARAYFEGRDWKQYLKDLTRLELDQISQKLQDDGNEEISKALDCEYEL